MAVEGARDRFKLFWIVSLEVVQTADTNYPKHLHETFSQLPPVPILTLMLWLVVVMAEFKVVVFGSREGGSDDHGAGLEQDKRRTRHGPNPKGSQPTETPAWKVPSPARDPNPESRPSLGVSEVVTGVVFKTHHTEYPKVQQKSVQVMNIMSCGVGSPQPETKFAPTLIMRPRP